MDKFVPQIVACGTPAEYVKRRLRHHHNTANPTNCHRQRGPKLAVLSIVTFQVKCDVR
jgi:hypothetical protein